MSEAVSSTPKVNVHILTWLLAACSMIGPFATDMYMPSFHEMTEFFGVSLEAVQQTLSSYLAGFALMTLFYGTISDIIGRKTTMVAGFVLFAVASLGAALAPSLDWLIFFRFCEGLFAGCGMVVGMAVIRDLYGGVQAQKLMAYVAMVFGFGPAIAPVLGGYFAKHLGWHSHFVALTAISVALAVLCMIFLPESLPKDKRTPVSISGLATGYKRSLTHKAFQIGNLALSLCFLGQGVFIAGAADWCVNVAGLEVDEFWMLFLPMIAGTVVGSWMSTRLAVKFGTAMTIRIGFMVLAAAAVFSGFAMMTDFMHAMPFAVMPLFVYTIGIGIVRPGMSLMLMDFFPKSRGMASSVQNFMQTVFFALCSAVVVPFLYGSGNLYWAALIVFGLSTIGLWTIVNFLRLKEHPETVTDRSI
ncbi:MAG: multidrug effflux MFS transporter [Sutterellaceae bacterium]|nr:multidrug effflux MFS transporter [Sutterellaceae bacterium]